MKVTRKNSLLMGLFLKHPVWVVIIIVLVGRSPFIFSSGVSLDDLKYFDTLPPSELLIAQGRWGWLLLERALFLFGLSGPHWGSVGCIIGLVALAIASWTIARSVFTDESEEMAVAGVAAVLFVMHPFHAEILSFREGFPFYATAILTGCVGLKIALQSKERRTLLLAAGLIAFALAINQLVINIIAVVLLLRAARSREIERPYWIAATIFIAILAYWGSVQALASVSGVAIEGRGRLIDLSAIPTRAGDLLELLCKLAYFDFLSYSPALSAIVGLLFWTGLILFVWNLPTARCRLLAVALLLFVPLVAVGVVAIGKVFWPAPRTLVGVALVTSVFVAIGVSALSRFERLGQVLFCVLFLGFSSMGATVVTDQQRLNERDRVAAQLIAARVSALDVRAIGFVGTWNEGSGIRSRVGDLSLSAFSIAWSRGPAIREYTGGSWEIVDSDDRPEWVDRCLKLKKWPSSDSVFVDGGVAVICL